jgi:cytosine/adenosine deaminase-related metal-dependent hydrolase
LAKSRKFHIGWRDVLSLVFLAVLVPWSSAWARPPLTADTVIVNARIYTVNAGQPWAEALAIGGDKILAVGSAKEIAAYRGPSTKVIDAQGKLILPGFVDCHIHFMEGSLGLTQVDLNGSKSVAEIQKRVKAYADAHPEEKWILGNHCSILEGIAKCGTRIRFQSAHGDSGIHSDISAQSHCGLQGRA